MIIRICLAVAAIGVMSLSALAQTPQENAVDRKATAEERAACAAAVGLLALDQLAVHYRIKALSGGRYRLTGRFTAEIVQACVVTLEPVPSNMSEGFEAEFRPEGDQPESAADEMEALSVTEFEPIENHGLEVGRIVVETLLASLPAYPRAPGAELEQHEAIPPPSVSTNPFAKLAALKDKDK